MPEDTSSDSNLDFNYHLEGDEGTQTVKRPRRPFSSKSPDRGSQSLATLTAVMKSKNLPIDSLLNPSNDNPKSCKYYFLALALFLLPPNAVQMLSRVLREQMHSFWMTISTKILFYHSFQRLRRVPAPGRLVMSLALKSIATAESTMIAILQQNPER